MNALLYTLLSTNASDQWVYTVFGGIRRTMLAHSGRLVSIAMMIASVIVVFKLIRMTYTIMSDDKQGGFGGITLWELLRPVVILVMIGSCSFFMGLLDRAADGVSVAIARSVNYTQLQASRATLLAELEAGETEIERLADSLKRKTYEDEAALVGKKQGNTKTVTTFLGSPTAGITSLVSSETATNNLSNEDLQKINREIDEIRANRVKIENTLKNYNGSTKKLRKQYQKIQDDEDLPKGTTPRTTFTALCFWLSDKIAYCMMAYADIILCCMCVIAPLVLALSLIEQWKASVVTFCAKYIEVSMWKVTSNIILATISKAYLAAVSSVQTYTADAMAQFASGNMDAGYATASSASMIATVICIAGIFATLSIPSITSTLLSLGGGPASGGEGAKGVATGILMAPGKAGSGALKAGSKIAGIPAK